ncbi:MAG TPA: ATP-binding cassette domain-containing protein [Acidobacteriaceae bacterium]|jgi:iron complex transport system ATP-binding protein|nr:ATP-binding cassette domain-containing protein [Acidobacteriaceae bacterium]
MRDVDVRPEREPFCELRRVNVARGDAIALHDIHLSIAAGEHVAILGPNGCGKSTLIKTLTCECYPLVVPGMLVQIFGRDRWDVQELRHRLGVVATELPGRSTARTRGLDAVLSGFFSSASLWANLTVTDEMHVRAQEALTRVDSQHLADKPVAQMSAGEARRVMIARALVHQPEMLLLDEPTNALDLVAQRDLRERLRGLAQAGTGIIMVTHHLADILPEIDRVILIRDGRIFADGDKQTLLTPATLEQLFGAPVDVVERNGYWHNW